MAGKQISGEGVPSSLAGMSKNQLYDIMSQMKALIEQNQQQARQILIQNPSLTRALFQAQIMLGMVQPPQAVTTVSSAATQSSQPPPLPTQPNVQPASSFPGQNQTRKQQQQPPPPIPQPQSVPLQPMQQPKLPPISAQSTPMSLPQSSPVPNISQLPHHSAPLQPPSHLQSPMPSPSPSPSTQSQQPMQNLAPPLQPQYPPLQPPQQPPLPPLPRPQMSNFGHQVHPHLGPNMGFPHPGAPPLHHSQPMFHSGNKPPASMMPSFPQAQPSLPSHSLPPPHYQGGTSKQTDRGSPWMPGLSENTTGTQLAGPPMFPGQMGAGNQPPRPPSQQQPQLTAEMEKALLQQVMSLTPEQINGLSPEQRNQILQLQQALRRN